MTGVCTDVSSEYLHGKEGLWIPT